MEMLRRTINVVKGCSIDYLSVVRCNKKTTGRTEATPFSDQTAESAMHTKTNEPTRRVDASCSTAEFTSQTISEICAEAHRLRAEIIYVGIVRAYRAARRATTAICRFLFTSEAHRHA